MQSTSTETSSLPGFLAVPRARTARQPTGAKPFLYVGRDEIFAQALKIAAAAQGMRVIHRQSPSDIVPDLSPKQVSVAIVEAQPGEVFDAAFFIDQWAPKLPVVLVGRTRLWVTSKLAWPRCVRNFLAKDLGAKTIVKEALTLCASIAVCGASARSGH